MRLIKETCVAGSTIDVSYRINSPKKKGEKRAAKEEVTPEKVQKINDRNAEKALTRILNHNFVPGDWHNVFTYAGKEPSAKEAKKHREDLCRDLNKLARKKGIIMKYVYVTEYKHDRIHHHIVHTYLPHEEVQALWPYGDVRPTAMKRNRNYKRLASYLIKETTKTFRQECSPFKRRYGCSRTIERPEVRKEYVSFSNLAEDPKPLTGYYIDQDTVRRGTHEVTGYPYLDYMMISLTEEPRIKKWRRGKKVSHQQNYNYLLRGIGVEEQIDFL